MFREIINDLKLYYSWSRILNSRAVVQKLREEHNAKVDNADRIHIVVNIPVEEIGEEYDLVKSDIDRLAMPHIRNKMKELSNYLNSVGLQEMYDYYEQVSKLEKYSYLIIIGFKPFDSVLYNTIVYRRILPVSVLMGIVYLSYIFIK
jgi:hypothetical protein